MFKTLKLLGVLVLAILPLGHASAAPMTENLVVQYTSASNFSFSSLNFSSTASPAINFLGSVSLGPYGAGTATIFNANVTLDTSQTYNFSFNTGTFSGNANLTPSSSSTTFAQIVSSGGGGFFTASASITPVVATTPLPASLPLFAMALLGLGVIGYRAARKSGSMIESTATNVAC